MYEELKNKLPAGYLNEKTTAQFAVLMHRRLEKGRSDYPTQKQYAPLEEAQEECADIAVYAMIMFYRIENMISKLKEAK